MEVVWAIILKELTKIQLEFDLRIAAFVLMGNHFHLLALTPNEPIDRIMYFLMKGVTREMQKRSGRINKIFGGRYKGCLIEDSKYLLNVYKYIYRNPVAAGIVDRAEDYPFSTYYMSETSNLPFKLDEVIPLNIPSRIIEAEWINSSYENEEAKSMKWGLSRSRFRYMKMGDMRKFIIPSITF